MGWNIDRSGLRDYREREGWLYDEKLFVTEDQKYGLLFYNISEVRMCTYYGTLAVYGRKDTSAPIISMAPGDVGIWYTGRQSFFYGPESDVLVFVCRCHKKDRTPYLLIKPTEGLFTMLPFDFTSIYYGFQEVERDRLVFTEKYPDEIERCVSDNGHERKTGWVLRLEGLRWYPVAKLDALWKTGKKFKRVGRRAMEKGQGGWR